MEPNKLSMTLNLSSQANMERTRNFSLSQYNFAVVLGSRLTEEYNRLEQNIRVRVNVKKTGEIEINGLPASDMKDPNIKIYSDVKKTVSDEIGRSMEDDQYNDIVSNAFTGGDTDG